MNEKINISMNALNFIDKKSLKNYVSTVVSIVKDSFSELHEIDILLEGYPELDDSWICFCATVSGSTDQIFEEYQKYTKEFCNKIPWPQINLIRFMWNII